MSKGNRSEDTGSPGVKAADITGTHRGLVRQGLAPFALHTNRLPPQTCKPAMNLCPTARTFCVSFRFRKRTMPSVSGQVDGKLAKLVLYMSSRTRLLKNSPSHGKVHWSRLLPTLLEGKKEDQEVRSLEKQESLVGLLLTMQPRGQPRIVPNGSH